MVRMVKLAVIAALASTLSVRAQSVPDLAFDANADLLRLPENIHLGEVAGVATNSRGQLFVYTRTGNPTITIGSARAFSHGGSRLFQFDQSGRFVREIGQGVYGFLFAQGVRIDRDDAIWTIDRAANQVVKFSPEGRVLMTLGRKPEAIPIPAPAPGAPPPGPPRAGGPPGSGVAGEGFNRPTDVAWDAAGNIYVADGYGNSRIVKFDRTGKYVKHWGQTGSGPGEFNIPHALAIDNQGLIYVADRGNQRVQVFDGDGTFKTQFTNIGAPTALCVTPGSRQFLYVSNSNPPDDLDTGGEIYKLDLSGRVVGRFGRAGKRPGEFGTVNAIDCRRENEIYVGEIGNWRVQKLTIRSSSSPTASNVR